MERSFYDSINAQIERHLANIESQQVSVEMSDDMAAFKDVHQRLKGEMHPTLNIDTSTIPAGTARWLCLRARRDNGPSEIGFIASRLFDDADLQHLFHSRVIWGDKRHARHIGRVEPIRHEWTEDLASVRGRLVYGGAAFLDRGFKGNELGRSMAGLMHAISMRIWNPDFLFNMMRGEKIGSKVAPERFGYRHTVEVFVPDDAPDWGPMWPHKFVNWKSRSEELEGYPLVPVAA